MEFSLGITDVFILFGVLFQQQPCSLQRVAHLNHKMTTGEKTDSQGVQVRGLQISNTGKLASLESGSQSRREFHNAFKPLRNRIPAINGYNSQEQAQTRSGTFAGAITPRLPGEMPHAPHHVAQVGIQPSIFDFVHANKTLNNDGSRRNMTDYDDDTSDQLERITPDKIREISNELSSQLSLASDERRYGDEDGSDAEAGPANYEKNANAKGVLQNVVQSIIGREQSLSEEVNAEMEAVLGKNLNAEKSFPDTDTDGDKSDNSLVAGPQETSNEA